MILNPRWIDWIETDEDGFKTKLKPDTPNDIKKEYEELKEEEQKNIKKGKLKKTIY